MSDEGPNFEGPDDLLAKLTDSVEYDTVSGCWLWAGTVSKGGYGSVRRSGKSWLAHRLAWAAVNGPITNGLHVCHRCDTPACINPAHLFLGTAKDNMADRKAKGRCASHVGALNGRARLNEDAVRAIRCSDLPFTELARQYGVTPEAVGYAARGQTWGHVT
jgi:hypothetical protein